MQLGLKSSVVHAARNERGKRPFTQLLFTSHVDGSPGSPDVNALIRPSKSQGVAMHVTNRRIVYETELLFLFRVRLDGRERMERLVPVTIDPVRERVVRSVAINDACFLPEAGGRGSTAMGYMLKRMYDVACRSMDGRIKRMAKDELERASDRESKERRTIESYYESLMQEELEPIKKTFRQMAVLAVRADLSRSSDREEAYRKQFGEIQAHTKQMEAMYERNMAALVRERERRLSELREAYAINAHVSLRMAALLIVPRVEWDLAFSGAGERQISVRYDCLRRNLLEWACEGCDMPFAHETVVCRCSSLMCTDCVTTCGGCGQLVCPECSDDMCLHCGRPTCTDCISLCPVGENMSPGNGPVVCAHCFDDVCAVCATGTAPGACLAYV